MSALPRALLRVIFFDLETNGCKGINKYSKRHNIVQFAAMLAGDPSKTLVSHVRPNYKILPESSKIHGITDKDVARAPTLPDVWKQFADAFLDDSSCNYLLVAHNAYGFDRPVLIKELVAHGVEILEDLAKRVYFADTLDYFKRLAPYEMREDIELKNKGWSKYNLGALYKFFHDEEPMVDAHDALGDVIAMQKICSVAGVDWERLFYEDERFSEHKVGLDFAHGSAWGNLLNESDELQAIRGIGEKRRQKIHQHLHADIRTIGELAACFSSEYELELFLREKIGVHDDAILVELVAVVSGIKNPLFAVLHKEFPYAKHVVDRLGKRHLEVDSEFSTVHELVERSRFGEISSETSTLINRRALSYYKFIL